MLEEVLKVFTEGERRLCGAFGPGWARCIGIEPWICMGKVLEEVVRVLEWP